MLRQQGDAMTEVEDRAALRAFGGSVVWNTGLPAKPGRRRPMAGGVRVTATGPGGGRRPQPSRKKRPSLVQEWPSLESRDQPLI
jgi:hypothetical protein